MEMNGHDARMLRRMRRLLLVTAAIMTLLAAGAYLALGRPAAGQSLCRPTQVSGMGLVLQDVAASDGPYVMAVSENGLAGQAGIEPGDKLTTLNGVALTTVSALNDQLGSGADTLSFTLDRDGATLTCVMTCSPE